MNQLEPQDSANGEEDEDQTFAQSVASAVCELIEKGHTDPHAEEIADAYFQRHIPTSIEQEVQSRLAGICSIVRDTYKNAHLVQSTYYETYQDGLPGNPDEAEACIPMGRGQQGVGIRVPQVQHDPILIAWSRQNLRGAGGKNKQNFNRLHSAYKAGKISAQDVYDAVRPYLQALKKAKKIENVLQSEGVLKGPLFASKHDPLPSADTERSPA